MTFEISNSVLLNAINNVIKVIDNKSVMPILDCIKFEVKGNKIILTGQDTQNTIVTTADLLSFSEDYTFALNAKDILSVAKSLCEGPATFEVVDRNMRIKSCGFKYSLPLMPVDEYPATTEFPEVADSFTMKMADLFMGINSTISATGDDELRQVMNGIYFDISEGNVTTVASDGHKLVTCDFANEDCKTRAAFILPKKPAKIIKATLTKGEGTATVTFNDRNAFFSYGSYTIICRLIEGRYPNYRSVIPNDFNHQVTVEKQDLLLAVRRVMTMASTSALVKMTLVNGELDILAEDVDYSKNAEGSIPCDYEGEETTVGMKGDSLEEMIASINCENIVLNIVDPTRAIVIKPETQQEDAQILALIMPCLV